MTLEEYKKEVGKNIKNLFNKANEEEKALLNIMINTINDLCEEKQELIRFLKEEQNRLTRECSQIYEDSLGRTRLVNEDIYNEVSKILSKIEKE